MPNLLLKFVILLEQFDGLRRFDGPLFHRWLPDGEKDALNLATDVSGTELKVWFERCGFVQNGLIQFDRTRKEVDPTIIPTQAALAAGSLFGLLEIQDITQEEETALRENKIGDRSYIALGERVLDKLIYLPVARFINTLRTKYGQYWIRELEEKHARNMSLGGYCSFLRLKWSLDEGVTWSDFIPDAPVRYITAIGGTPESFRNYMTKEDWKDLAQLGREKFEPPLASLILSRARQLLDEENYKYAFVEGVTALDIGLDTYTRLKSKEPSFPPRSTLENMHLEEKLKAVAQFLALPNKGKTIKLTIQALKARNKAAHEIFHPSEKDKLKIVALLQVVATLNFGSQFKLPSFRLGNRIMPAEQWERHSQKQE